MNSKNVFYIMLNRKSNKLKILLFSVYQNFKYLRCVRNSIVFIYIYSSLFNLILMLFLTQTSQAQNSGYYFIEEFENSEIYKIDKKISQIRAKKNLAYLNLLPTVNYHYNPINNQSYVSVGISFNRFATYFQNNNRNKIEIKKIENTLLERLSTKINSLENEYDKILSDIEILTLKYKNLKLENQLFNLKRKQYENNKINLEKWLQIQISYKKKELIITNNLSSIKRRLSAFYKKIKSPRSEFLELKNFQKTEN